MVLEASDESIVDGEKKQCMGALKLQAGAHLGRKWKTVSTKTTILVDYLRKWRLQLSIGKTVSAAYHLNNKERLHPESHSSVVLLVQHGEPLPKHYGSPRKPWHSPQLNTVPLSGAEAHTGRRLTSRSTALCGPYLVVSSRHLCYSSLS